MSVISLKKEIKSLHTVLKPDPLPILVIFYDENETIVEIQGHDVTGCTEAEINKILSSSHVHYYLPMPDTEDLE